MVKLFLKTAFRNLWKTKTYSLLNVTGLIIGIASAGLILLWVESELTFNQQFPKKSNLYQVMQNRTLNGSISTFISTPDPLAQALKSNIPGVKNAFRYPGYLNELFSMGDKAVDEWGSCVDSSIFSMLDLQFVYGHPKNAFAQLHSLVISQTMSEKFFRDTDPVGKTLKAGNDQEYAITGVFKDFSANSSFSFQWLAPIEVFEAKYPRLKDWAGGDAFITVVQLTPGADASLIDKEIRYYPNTTKTASSAEEYFLFPMNDWHLRNHFVDGKENGGAITYVRLFVLIAWIILILACVNFMNLATARSAQRAKEVAVRKVIGSGKKELIGQFIGESLILSYLASALSIFVIFFALPSFNRLVDKQITLDILNPVHILSLLLIGLITGILAGSYPAFYLSSFNPLTALKSRFTRSRGAGNIRKILVVLQFSASILLIICTIIIYQQVQHVKSRDIGYDKNGLIYLPIQGQLSTGFTAIRNDLLSTGFVSDVALSYQPILNVQNSTPAFTWAGKDPSMNIMISFEGVSQSFIPTMDIRLASGQNFHSDVETDSNNVIINQALADKMGEAGKVGKLITDGTGYNLKIIGIVKNFLFNDIYGKAWPIILYHGDVKEGYVSIRFKSGTNLTEALAKTRGVLLKDNPGFTFDYKFVDEGFDQLFKNETLLSKLSAILAVMAIFISCLGLFGLAAYTAELRTKEIGIRKVIGASVSSLIRLIANEFLKLVAISCLIAFPLSWIIMNNWLKDYAYHTTIHWWVYGITGIGVLVITLCTVSFQAIKAALINPVKSLKFD
jgi:ABC-type antimicrobial peptide transport system permease subunit